MRSRGITLEDAKVLQMISFISPVLENIPDEIERTAIATEFESHIRNIIRNI
jgi:Fe-S cluster assembly scaffold protein SufB